MLWGNTQSNAPSRFLDDLPEEVIERRSDELLSAFAWATESGRMKAQVALRARAGHVEPFRQEAPTLDVQFNQDLQFEEGELSEQMRYEKGTRIEHPAFGQGTVLRRRGGIVDVLFDDGKKKSFALSIAPLRVL
jgi:hypothetical protein